MIKDYIQVNNKSFSINFTDPTDNGPVHWALIKRNEDLLDLVIEDARFDLNTHNPKTSFHPVFYAIVNCTKHNEEKDWRMFQKIICCPRTNLVFTKGNLINNSMHFAYYFFQSDSFRLFYILVHFNEAFNLSEKVVNCNGHMFTVTTASAFAGLNEENRLIFFKIVLSGPKRAIMDARSPCCTRPSTTCLSERPGQVFYKLWMEYCKDPEAVRARLRIELSEKFDWFK